MILPQAQRHAEDVVIRSVAGQQVDRKAQPDRPGLKKQPTARRFPSLAGQTGQGQAQIDCLLAGTGD